MRVTARQLEYSVFAIEFGRCTCGMWNVYAVSVFITYSSPNLPRAEPSDLHSYFKSARS